MTLHLYTENAIDDDTGAPVEDWERRYHHIDIKRVLSEKEYDSLTSIYHKLRINFTTNRFSVSARLDDNGRPVTIELEDDSLESVYKRFVDVVLDKAWRY